MPWWSLVIWVGKVLLKSLPTNMIIFHHVFHTWVQTFFIDNMENIADCIFIGNDTKTWGLFIKSPETFRAYSGCHNCLYVFATPRFLAFKLRNPLGFSDIKNG